MDNFFDHVVELMKAAIEPIFTLLMFAIVLGIPGYLFYAGYAEENTRVEIVMADPDGPAVCRKIIEENVKVNSDILDACERVMKIVNSKDFEGNISGWK